MELGCHPMISSEFDEAKEARLQTDW